MVITKNLGQIICGLIGNPRSRYNFGCSIVPTGTISVFKGDKIKMRIIEELKNLDVVEVEDCTNFAAVNVTAGWKSWVRWPEKPKSEKDLIQYLESVKKEIKKDLGCSDIEINITF